MPDNVLTLLKYVFLAVLYLFFLRVLRAVWVELREPKVAPPAYYAPEPQLPAGVGAGGPWPAPTRGPVASGAPLGSFSGPPPYPGGPADPFGPTSAISAQPHPGASAGPTTGPHLIVVAPPERVGGRYPITQEVTIGRAGGCAISLPDDTFVSQIHARVFPRDGQVWVEDLGSTNGTFVNGVKVTTPVLLHLRDRLQVGNTVLECGE